LSWFGDRFRVSSSFYPGRAYENGLTYLVRLNFLQVVMRPEGAAFAMPPNQRLPMRALRDSKAPLPDAVPVRGVKERLAMGLERGRTTGVYALQDFLAMEEDYRDHVADPMAATAIFHSMMARSEVSGFLQGTTGATAEEGILRPLDDIVRIYDDHRT